MTEESVPMDELILHLREKHKGSNTDSFELSDFAFAFGSPLDVLMYVKLCWPDFIEFSGMIFHPEVLNSNDDRERASLMKAGVYSRSDVEKSFNQFTVPSSFFGKYAGESSEAEDLYLAELIREMWQARLAMLFPGRKARVVCTIVEGDEPLLSVFQDED